MSVGTIKVPVAVKSPLVMINEGERERKKDGKYDGVRIKRTFPGGSCKSGRNDALPL